MMLVTYQLSEATRAVAINLTETDRVPKCGALLLEINP